ncbi:melatonin receptor type 1C-like [Protopterus annectens]|uniref:melatonin receptor type 1C-like n=1 Tax=Protopterus annectens TaxID=7888 RepID=UPI001CFBA3E5|nr:melatonin receptor type 1C-like [Protopterus annectens]
MTCQIIKSLKEQQHKFRGERRTSEEPSHWHLFIHVIYLTLLLPIFFENPRTASQQKPSPNCPATTSQHNLTLQHSPFTGNLICSCVRTQPTKYLIRDLQLSQIQQNHKPQGVSTISPCIKIHCTNKSRKWKQAADLTNRPLQNASHELRQLASMAQASTEANPSMAAYHLQSMNNKKEMMSDNGYGCNTSCSESDLKGGNHTDPVPYWTSAAVTILQASVMSFTIVTDIIGNILVIISVLQNKKLRSAGNIFVISLSVADLMVALYPYPLISHAILQKAWTLGYVHCKISSVIHSLSLIGSVYNILAIAVNRYFCICHSSMYENLYSMKNTYLYVFLTWTISVILLLPIISVNALQYEPRVYSCVLILSVNQSLTIAMSSFQFIPISIVIFCYVRIWILVIQVKYRVRQDSKQKLKSSELRHFFTMFAVFVLFAVCWGPFSVIGLVVGFTPAEKAIRIPDWLITLSYFMAYFNSCLNGIIYGVFNHNFRNEYKRIALSLCTCMSKQLQKMS